MRRKAAIQGRIFVIAGPSGVGKDTIVRQIKESLPIFYNSISVTTRMSRPSEENGVDYYFVDDVEFRRMINANELLEYAQVHDHYYGTLLEPIKSELQNGQSILMVIDPLGAVVVKERLPEMVLIYVQFEPGRIRQRIRTRLKHDNTRGKVSDEEITLRTRTARREETLKSFFDYVVTNYEGKLEETVENILNIIKAELAK